MTLVDMIHIVNVCQRFNIRNVAHNYKAIFWLDCLYAPVILTHKIQDIVAIATANQVI